MLETDHKVTHEQIAATVESANAFLRTAVNDPDPLRRTGDAYVRDQRCAPLRLLTRRLSDEEDLIIRLILDRGEAALGVG